MTAGWKRRAAGAAMALLLLAAVRENGGNAGQDAVRAGGDPAPVRAFTMGPSSVQLPYADDYGPYQWALQNTGTLKLIPGSRPAGIYTAGVAQEYINLRNRMVGREVVILGSGDIGMIMARRLTLEGAHVKGVYEVQPYPSGLPRNIEQCLNDYSSPLHLSHTVTDIHGRARLEGVTISRVDERFRPIPGTEERVDCDTLILSVGLIPAGDIANGSGLAVDGRTRGAFVDEHYQTSIPGVFAAGNVLHVHDLVDFVSLEAEALADAAAEYLRNGALPPCPLAVRAGDNVGHVRPQHISGTRDFTLSLRVSRPLKKATLTVRQNGREVLRRVLPKALPAEMLQLSVKAVRLDTSGDLEVSVS